MFKRILFFALFIGSVQLVQAQDMPTLEDILTNYYENVGGAENWKALESMKMIGSVATQGIEMSMEIFSARPNKVRREMDMAGQKMVMAYDGEDAWWINPFMGGPEPQAMPEEMAQQFMKEKFEDPLIDYQEKGHELELVGTAEVDGTETYELKLTKEDGEVRYYYFDTEYFVPILQKMEVSSGPQKGSFVETYQSDYQEVDGLMIPHFLETKGAGQEVKITLSEITLNPELEEGVFSRPKE